MQIEILFLLWINGISETA